MVANRPCEMRAGEAASHSSFINLARSCIFYAAAWRAKPKNATKVGGRPWSVIVSVGAAYKTRRDPSRSGRRSCGYSGRLAGQRNVPSACRVKAEPGKPPVKDGRAHWGEAY